MVRDRILSNRSMMLFLSLIITLALTPKEVESFSNGRLLKKGFQYNQIDRYHGGVEHHKPLRVSTFTTKTSSFAMSSTDNDEYSREIRLREEVESPFRKVRFLLYFNLLGGALTSLAVSGARIAAALSGVNTDLMQESVNNAIVDILGIIVIGYFYKQDLASQESKLKRAAKGASLANLQIRGSASLLSGASSVDIDPSRLAGRTAVVPIKTFRRGRGIEKRIVITIASREKLESVLEQVKELSDSLIVNDLIIVPVVTPQYTAPLGIDNELIQLDCLAFPAGGNWMSVLTDETEQAREQGVDVENEGICIVLKKNGRVGTRTKGIFLDNMVGDVLERQEMGMDVSNI